MRSNLVRAICMINNNPLSEIVQLADFSERGTQKDYITVNEKVSIALFPTVTFSDC